MTTSSSREPRGFALYVGISEADARAAGISLQQLVTDLKKTVNDHVPHAETHAAIALAPEGAGGRHLDIVRMALHDPIALGKLAHDKAARESRVVIDISRRRVVIDDEQAALTYKEFSLLQFLVLREGQTVNRDVIIDAVWSDGDEDVPVARTIDVHIRRLRSKLGRYEDIVRTVRGVGYRFDRHADVTINYGVAQSPDMI
ncbi:MAG: winged helix-turn-helix transcriptional regulator [Microbacteriaceae bacterium]|jgi:DNA-binding winged helix-turn-helix (wHTH) protein|nr:winged helix-turn-helix transcriptional regulator [Microbacteriaceae bacterium]